MKARTQYLILPPLELSLSPDIDLDGGPARGHWQCLGGVWDTNLLKKNTKWIQRKGKFKI